MGVKNQSIEKANRIKSIGMRVSSNVRETLENGCMQKCRRAFVKSLHRVSATYAQHKSEKKEGKVD